MMNTNKIVHVLFLCIFVVLIIFTVNNNSINDNNILVAAKSSKRANGDDNVEIIVNEEEDEVTFNEVITERPPERDLKDSQPTISVNYRVVDTKFTRNKSYNEQNRKNNIENITGDWEENDEDW